MRRGGGEWDTAKCGVEQEAVKSFSYYWWTEIESRSWGGNDIKPYFITHLDLPTFIHIMGVLQQRQILGKLKGYVKYFLPRHAATCCRRKCAAQTGCLVSVRGCSKQRVTTPVCLRWTKLGRRQSWGCADRGRRE